MSIMHLVAQLRLHIEYSNRIFGLNVQPILLYHIIICYQVSLFFSEVYVKKLIVNSIQDDKRHSFGIDFYITLDTPCKSCIVSVGHLHILDFTVNFTHSRSRALAEQLAINVLNPVIKCVNCLSLVMKCLHNY